MATPRISTTFAGRDGQPLLRCRYAPARLPYNTVQAIDHTGFDESSKDKGLLGNDGSGRYCRGVAGFSNVMLTT